MSEKRDFPNATIYVTIHEKEIDPSTLIFDEKVRDWCRLPYPGHPKGCPNDCPARKTPAAEFERRIKNEHEGFVLAWAEFDFKEYKSRMRVLHPGWTENQVKNVLYWQSSVKSVLARHIHTFHSSHVFLGSGSGAEGFPSMEAAGINVFAALSKNGIEFEKKPVDKVLIVFLSMKKKRKNVLF